jgi:hypothetical protein
MINALELLSTMTAAVWLVAAVRPCASKTQAKAQGCFTGCDFWNYELKVLKK